MDATAKPIGRLINDGGAVWPWVIREQEPGGERRTGAHAIHPRAGSIEGISSSG
jgi:hypothetical protein